MSDDTERLTDALTDAALELIKAVGIAETLGPGAPRTGCRIDRDRVPAGAWRAATLALDILTVGIGLTDPDVPADGADADAELEMLLGARGAGG